MSLRDHFRRASRFLAVVVLPVVLDLPVGAATPLRSNPSPTALLPGDERPVSAKLDPSLRRLVRNAGKGNRDALALPATGREAFFRTERLGSGELAAAVFVRSTDPARARQGIGALGGTVRAEAGDVLVAIVPVSSLEELASRPETISMKASHAARLVLDVSRPATKADLVQAGTGLPEPRTGAGVIVGIVDTGVDTRHESFRTASGTRIRSVWSVPQETGGGGVPAICSREQVEAGTCAQRDANGHGSHVAGIAAGNGRAQAGYVGMAPSAEIVAAKVFRGSDGSLVYPDDVAAACAYVFEEARAAGKPAVINLSIATVMGPLDGTTGYERFLSSLTGPGRIIVAGNGNSGDKPVHLSYAASGSGYPTSTETGLDLTSTLSASMIDLWYASGSISVGLAYRATPDAMDPSAVTPPVAPAESTGWRELRDPASGDLLARYSIDAGTTEDPDNGAHNVQITLEPAAPGSFSLYTFGSGTFDAWAVGPVRFSTRSGRFWAPGDSRMTVGSPAAAKKVIGVGAWTTKKQWVDVDDVLRTFSSYCFVGSSEEPGDISCFSSRGPTRDGRTRPDVAAPGNRIASALSGDAVPTPPAANRLPGGALVMDSGTSMAAPHVSGIVALMLEADPGLTYERAVEVLQSTATKDVFTGPATSNTWGAGKVNALEAVRAVADWSAPTTCTPGAATLCLGRGGRFKVQAAYRDWGGNAGAAQVHALLENGGYLTFADPGKVELVVKFVDFCGHASGNWGFYAAGLTDVEVALYVTDTRTGVQKEYRNPLGGRFCAITDGSFPCP